MIHASLSARFGLRTLALALGLSSAVTGCMTGDPALDNGPEPSGSTAQAITNGTAVSSGSPLALATVRITGPNSGCTGVLVSPRHVLTAAHCEFSLTAPSNLTVTFYRGRYPDAATAGVTRVDIRPGVNINPGSGFNGLSNDDLQDVNDKFADLLVLTLDANAPSFTRPALLPLSYPGNNVTGYLVGAGNHNGQANTTGEMRYLHDSTYSSDNHDGHFLVNTADVNPGDSGGPFLNYVDGRLFVHGVLFGTDIEWALHSKYTSLEYHLPWILDRMNYNGGMTTSTNTLRSGTLAELRFTTSWRECALACAQSSTCQGYYHIGATCNLLSSVSNSSAAVQGATSGMK